MENVKNEILIEISNTQTGPHEMQLNFTSYFGEAKVLQKFDTAKEVIEFMNTQEVDGLYTLSVTGKCMNFACPLSDFKRDLHKILKRAKTLYNIKCDK